MTQWHGKAGRKPSGGRSPAHRGKRRAELGSDPQPTTLGEDKRAKIRIRGGDKKTRLVRAETANIVDPDSGDAIAAEIETVVKNEANPHYVRRNIITKGAIIRTSEGDARVTSRPGQDGSVNAVLLED